MPTFKYEFLLALILLLPLLFFFYQKAKEKTSECSLPASFFRLAKEKMKISFFKKYGLVFLRLLTIFFLILVLARPQSESAFIEKKEKGIDIVLALDVSLSMLAEDMKPNRMEVAKDTIVSFIDKLRSGDRMSLVVFSGRPFTNVPLTTDFSVLKSFASFLSIDMINQNIAGLNGTGIGNALVYSTDKFDEESERERVIILLTDGESNRGVDPISSSKLAVQNGIKIYTIGIGKREGAPVPIETQAGKKEFIRNGDGSIFLTYLDEETLKEIAKMSNAKYFHADSKNVLQNVFSEIYSLEKKDAVLEKSILKEDTYHYFALLALLFFLIEIIFSFSLLKRSF